MVAWAQSSRRWFLAGTVGLLAVHVGSWYVAHGEGYTRAPVLLGWAVSFDLTVTASLIAYFAWVRRAGLPKVLVSATLLLALVLLSTVYPAEIAHRGAILLGGIELLLLAMLVRVGVRGFRRVRASAQTSMDGSQGEVPWVAPIRAECCALLGQRVGWVVANEVLLLAALFGRGLPRQEGYSHHRNAHWQAVVTGGVVLLAFEGIALHLVLAESWSSAGAWLVSALEFYGVLWLLGDLRALKAYRTQVSEEGIALRLGLRFDCRIPAHRILAVSRMNDGEDEEAFILRVAGRPNVLIALNEGVEVRTFWGGRPVVRALAVEVDDPETFVSDVSAISEGARTG